MPSNNKVLFKFGTRAEYDALSTKLSNALYFLTDTGELYRGMVPIGQAHIYTGTRQTDEANGTALARITSGYVLVNNDLAIITNSDNTTDIFIYNINSWIQLNTNSAVLEQEVTSLASTVANLDTLLNGTPADTEQGIPAVPGLTDRVATLESQMSAASGAFHFKGTTSDLTQIQNPSEGDVYQVGSDEYAWNGITWVKLGGEFDTSNLATKAEVASLEALIGTPATTTTVHNDETGEDETVTIPASGIYADLAQNAANIIPVFDGNVEGLVPVPVDTLTNAQKASLFMNALGQWVTVSSGSGGQTIYTDPEGHTYNTVEAYVEHMIETVQYEWEAIA